MTTADVPTFGRAAGAPDELVDPDLAPDSRPDTELDELRAELASDVTATTTLPVPGRPRYAATFRLDFTGKDLDTYRKRSKDKTYADGVDGIRFAAILLAATNTVILRDGAPLELGGTPQTFRERDLLDLLGVDRAADGVRKLYGLDGAVDAAARAVLEAAGWGDDLDAIGSDPT
jgi:hypothetical protein